MHLFRNKKMLLNIMKGTDIFNESESEFNTEIYLDKRKAVLHHVAENVDHNILTLDGHGHFHGNFISLKVSLCIWPIQK